MGSVWKCALIGYTFGSFNPSVLVGKLKGYNVRQEGSKNPGASNSLLLGGPLVFLLVALLDMGKSYAACRICRYLFPGRRLSPLIGGVSCVMGHMYPVTLKLRGGKGLACLGGIGLYFGPRAFTLMLAIALLIALTTGYLCFVAPAMSVILPIYYLLLTGITAGFILLLLPSPFILWKHLENFRRISAGTELPFSYLWNKERALERVGGPAGKD